jgi:TM2 domain-containing membrane protein YozV
MSLLLPGLGQLYLGRPGRAGIWFGGLVLIYLIAGAQGAPRWISPVVATALGVVAALDALIIGRGTSTRP